MEGLLAIIWFFIVLAFPLSLFVSAYVVHVRGLKFIDIAAKLVLGFIVYGFFSIGTGLLLSFMIFVGAHTEPVGQALGTKGRVLVAGILVLFALTGWLMSSVINGSLIWPSSRK